MKPTNNVELMNKCAKNKFEIELTLIGLGKNTINCYVSSVAQLLSVFKRRPKQITNDDIKIYLSSLSRTTAIQSRSAFIHYFKLIVGQPRKLDKIKTRRLVKKLPHCISKENALKLINSSQNLKHTAILYLLYTSGIRRSELVNLKIYCIDSDRMMIHIHSGKGNKDRFTVLSKGCLNVLRAYFKEYTPKLYLFEGKPGMKYSTSSVCNIVKKSGKMIGLHAPVTPHTLRHSFATHLLESGVDVAVVSRLLGHSKISTTQIYLHISNMHLANVTDLSENK